MRFQIKGNCPGIKAEGGIYGPGEHTVKLCDEHGEEIEGVDSLAVDSTMIYVAIPLRYVDVRINQVVDSIGTGVCILPHYV